ANHPLAAAAGVDMLQRGGNAIDAAMAANAMMGLVEPASNGIGGDLFVLYNEAGTGKTVGLNASGWSPAALSADVLSSRGLAEMPSTGIHTVTVPGAVAGWCALRERLGTLPLAEILVPVIHYADAGFPVSEIVAAGWANCADRLWTHPNAAQTYLPNGQPPRTGEVFTNPDLAASLRRIAESGRNGFYRGPTANAILRLSSELGGTLSADDLQSYEPEWVEPIRTTYRGWTVMEIPPNSTGIAALMMLNIMEQFPLREWGFHSSRALHVMIESKKLAFADLIRYIGDPRFSTIPTDSLLDGSHGVRRARQVDMKRASGRVEPAHLDGFTTSKGHDTIYLCAIDSKGNIASLIQSIYAGFGSSLVAEGTGFALHNRGALFTLQPNHPNTLMPRKRPLHTIIPGFMQKDDIRIGFGIMGGFNQPQAHAQFVANIADFDLTIQEALEAGRFTKPTFEGCDVSVEPLIPEAVLHELRALGHDLQVEPYRSGVFGWGHAVMCTPSGVHFGASEPRHDGAAIPQLAPAGGYNR
ncbi:MAG TPA: gamma-glutamyltransferase family protein, partial [Terriglobia bacterium]|nr:gamma-glutamyltransferase family protein [Terriglobia bacterium]